MPKRKHTDADFPASAPETVPAAVPAADPAENTEPMTVELTNRISSRFFGEIDAIRALAKSTKPTRVGLIVGIVDGADLIETENGTSVEFSGQFRAQCLADNRQTDSTRAIIPGPLAELLFQEIKNRGTRVEGAARKGKKARLVERWSADPVEFGVAIGVVKAPSATGYGWTSESLIGARTASPLDALMNAAKAPRQLSLPFDGGDGGDLDA